MIKRIIVERMFFYIVAIALFVILFLKTMKKNNTLYLISLVLQAIGIIISFLGLILKFDLNVIIKAIIYIISIGIPIGIIICEIKKINLVELFYVGIAKLFLFIKNTKKAKIILLKLVEKDEDSKTAHKMLAEMYEKEGGLRRAIDEYVKVVDMDGEAYDSYYKIAMLLKDLGNKEDSLNMLSKLVNKKPDYVEACLALSDAFCEGERYKEALNVMNECLRYNPNNFDIYYNLGMIYTMLNDFSSAKEAYEKAAIINTLEYHTNYNIAMIELILGELDEAEKYFNSCLEDEELSPYAYYQLAKICMLRGDKETASQYLNLAIELENKLYIKAMEENIFIPIKGYINYPFMDKEEDIEEKMNQDISREEQIMNHLEETYKLVGKLNYREMGTKYSIKENSKDMQLEQE